MAVRRGTRGDGIVRIGRPSAWRWVLLLAGGLVAAGPLLLSLAAVLPPVVVALPPAVLGLAVWTVSRRLDRSRRAPAPGGAGGVVPTLDEARRGRPAPRRS